MLILRCQSHQSYLNVELALEQGLFQEIALRGINPPVKHIKPGAHETILVVRFLSIDQIVTCAASIFTRFQSAD